MKLNSGVRLGPYEVIASIGAGGMGEVYKAKDSRLDRFVAIKVLPAVWSADPDRRARFDREARAVAALSHPNICAIHDVGHQEGIDFLVLEYLDGETLAARIERSKPLSVDETVRIATAIADALADAHRAGVIHRDLKPGNVMLTRTGVKVVDFGLAKLSGGEPDALSSITNAETVPLLSRVGAITGTLPYMSPEQIEGRPVDSRSDLFAFGAIVYEMATGQRAFQGASQPSVIAAILERMPPPMSSSQPLIPPALERLVEKCLAKDPDARWQSASDVADELRWLSTSPIPTLARARVRRVVPAFRWLAVAVALAIVAVGIWRWQITRDESSAVAAREMLQERVTFAGDLTAASLSPDGRSIAFASGHSDATRVVVRDLASGQELEVWRGTHVIDLEWFPNGTQIAISGLRPADNGIYVVSRLGGSARRLDFGGGYLAISPDGAHVAWASQDAKGVSVAPIAGGSPRRIAGSEIRFLYGLDWTRANRLLIPVATTGSQTAVMSASSDGTHLEQVFGSGSRGFLSVCATPTADAFYVFAGTRLQRVAFIDGAAQAPEVIRTGLTPPASPVWTCNVSEDGQRLIQVRREAYANLWRLDLHRAGQPATPLTKGTARYVAPHISRDGQWIVYSGGPQGEIAKVRFGGGEPISLTKGAGPLWSPDGKRLAFLSDRGGKPAIWIGDSDGRQAVELAGAQINSVLWTWLPDNRVAWQTADARNYQIRDPGSGRDEFLVKNPAVGFVFTPRFNTRGDTVAVFWNRKPRGLWTLSWPDRAERFLAAELIPDGWSPDGKWIYAHRPDTRSIVRVATDTGLTETVGEFPVGTIPMVGCDVKPDGSAIVCSLNETTSDAWLIQYHDPQVRTVKH